MCLSALGEYITRWVSKKFTRGLRHNSNCSSLCCRFWFAKVLVPKQYLLKLIPYVVKVGPFKRCVKNRSNNIKNSSHVHSNALLYYCNSIKWDSESYASGIKPERKACFLRLLTKANLKPSLVLLFRH